MTEEREGGGGVSKDVEEDSGAERVAAMSSRH